MIDVANGCGLEVERGPDWLFVRVKCPDGRVSEDVPLAEAVWSLLEQHFTRRLILELDEVAILRSSLIGQLVMLHKRIHTHAGLMRICGLSEPNQEVLRTCRLSERFPVYNDRIEAVRGYRLYKPR
jgi:anti-anti-sigma factor